MTIQERTALALYIAGISRIACRDWARRAMVRRFGGVPPSLEEWIAEADAEPMTTLVGQAPAVESFKEIRDPAVAIEWWR